MLFDRASDTRVVSAVGLRDKLFGKRVQKLAVFSPLNWLLETKIAS